MVQECPDAWVQVSATYSHVQFACTAQGTVGPAVLQLYAPALATGHAGTAGKTGVEVLLWGAGGRRLLAQQARALRFCPEHDAHAE